MFRLTVLGFASMLILFAAVGSAAPPPPHRIADDLRDVVIDSMANPEPPGDDLDPDTEAATAVPDAKSITTLVRDGAPPEATTHDGMFEVTWAA